MVRDNLVVATQCGAPGLAKFPEPAYVQAIFLFGDFRPLRGS